jgi:hypothetical protein
MLIGFRKSAWSETECRDYYRLSWKKPSGAQLHIIWRYRQDFGSLNGWNGQILKEVIRIDIRPTTK